DGILPFGPRHVVADFSRGGAGTFAGSAAFRGFLGDYLAPSTIFCLSLRRSALPTTGLCWLWSASKPARSASPVTFIRERGGRLASRPMAWSWACRHPTTSTRPVRSPNGSPRSGGRRVGGERGDRATASREDQRTGPRGRPFGRRSWTSTCAAR